MVVYVICYFYVNNADDFYLFILVLGIKVLEVYISFFFCPPDSGGAISSELKWNPLFGLCACESLEKASADLSAGPPRHAGLRFWNRFFSTPFRASRGHVLHIFSLQTREDGALTHTRDRPSVIESLDRLSL